MEEKHMRNRLLQEKMQSDEKHKIEDEIQDKNIIRRANQELEREKEAQNIAKQKEKEKLLQI